MADLDPILRPAIEAAITAENADPDDPDFSATRGVLVAYVVVAVTKGFDDDGDGMTQTMIFPEGSFVEQLGMVTEAQIRYHATAVSRYQ